MSVRLACLCCLLLALTSVHAQELPPSDPTLDPADAAVEYPEEESDSVPAEETQDETAETLAYSQKELQQLFRGGIGLNLGPVMPWSSFGLSLIWPYAAGMGQLSLGSGSFEVSDNYQGRNFLVKAESQGAYLAYRNFPLGFGPLYLEPMMGIIRWNGSIRPRGFDASQDELASSLTSRFDSFGLSLGSNLGLMWIFSNGIFLDYNLISLSWAYLLQENYTANTSAARQNVRKQIRGPITMSSLHIRIGWSIDI